MTIQFAVAVALAAAAFAISWAFTLRDRLAASRRSAAALGAEVGELTKSLTDSGVAVEKAKLDLTTFTANLERLAGKLEEMKALAQREHDRAERFFTHIDTACKERDRWCEQYHAAVMGFMRTQDFLLAECGRLSRVAKVPVQPVLQTLVDGYRAEHAAALAASTAPPTKSDAVAPDHGD